MTEEDKLSKKMLLFMFAVTMVLLLAVLLANAFYSPKFSNMDFVTEISEPDSESFDSVSHIPDNDSIFPIGINTASSEDLEQIPNIGPVTAKLIIDYRNEYGTIKDFDELISIDGIGEKTIEVLKEYCIIN